MSEENIEKFFKFIDERRDEVMHTRNFNEFAAVASRHGFKFTAEELREYLDQGLSPHALKVVSRGMDGGCIKPSDPGSTLSQ